MVQLRILAGKQAGTSIVLRNFPAIIGRASSASVVLEENGVWDEHIEIACEPTEGLVVRTHRDALASINGQRIESARLRNGDIIEIGSARLQFWLSEAPQRSLRPREILTWIALGVICAIQVAIIYSLSDSR